MQLDPMQAVPLREFGKRLNPKVAYRTVAHWATNGRINRKTRAVVKLDTIMLPCGSATTTEAYKIFIERLSAG